MLYVDIFQQYCQEYDGQTPTNPRGAGTMIKILRIDTSPRPEMDLTLKAGGSYSRALASSVVAHLNEALPGASVLVRDLVVAPVPHIANETIIGYYTDKDQQTPMRKSALAQSDRLIAELRAADIVVLSVPIYNFSVPSSLKAWIDHIVRISETFSYTDGNFQGLLYGKKAYLCCSYGAGGYMNGGPLAGYDSMAPYLTMILNFIGIKDVTMFAVEATTGDAETIDKQITIALDAMRDHFSAFHI